MQKDSLTNLEYGARTAGISTILIFCMTLTEALVGIFSGSLVLLSDALHNATDSASGVTSWLGLKISQRESDEKFPYGYYKAENIATLLISLFILYAAFELLRRGYLSLFTVPSLKLPVPALAMALTMAIFSLLLSRYLQKVGERINSQSLIANGKEKKIDVLASSITFVAILLTYYEIPYVQGIITIFFSLIAFKFGISTAKDAIYALMDIQPLKEANEVKKVLGKMPGIEDFENLKLRRAGPFVFGEVDLKVRKDFDVQKAHDIAERIESTIKEKVDQVNALTIHVEPFEPEKRRVMVPVEAGDGLSAEMSDHFGRASFFLIVTISREGEVLSMERRANPYKENNIQAGFSVSEYLVDEEIDVVISKELGEIAFHTLKAHLIDLYKTTEATAGETIKKFTNDELEALSEPTKSSKSPKRTSSKRKPHRGRRGFGRRNSERK